METWTYFRKQNQQSEQLDCEDEKDGLSNVNLMKDTSQVYKIALRGHEMDNNQHDNNGLEKVFTFVCIFKISSSNFAELNACGTFLIRSQ